MIIDTLKAPQRGFFCNHLHIYNKIKITMILAPDPGPWQWFIRRSDNVGLPTHVVKLKYIQQQQLFEQSMLQSLQQQMAMYNTPQASVQGSPADNTVNDYMIDDYVEDYIQ